MKRVEAIVSPLHLEGIKDRLRMIGVPGMTIQEVRVPGDGQTAIYRGLAPVTDLSARIRLDVVVADDAVDGVTRAISQVVCRSESGDGIIFIAPVDEAIRIRTGETGSDAL
jgi:nitrogen regulatory protein P-II 1